VGNKVLHRELSFLGTKGLGYEKSVIPHIDSYWAMSNANRVHDVLLLLLANFLKITIVFHIPHNYDNGRLSR